MSKLFNIEKEVIDIANNNSNDIAKLKNNIKAYFKNIDEKDLEILEKKEKYLINYENKRNINKIEYEKYLKEKNVLKTIFENEKTKISLYNYLKLKCPIKNNIPDLYTYENIELKNRVIIPREPIANVNKVKKNKKEVICPEGKEINPVTGRCVNICVDGKVRDPVTGICKTIKIEKIPKVKKVVKVVIVPKVVKPEEEIIPDVPDDIPKVVKTEEEIIPDVLDDVPKVVKPKVVKPKVVKPEEEIIPDVPDDIPKVVKTEEEIIPDVPDDVPKVPSNVKVVNIKNVKCPDGKEVNPLTGRFVNKCKDGEERDSKTGKCKKKLKK